MTQRTKRVPAPPSILVRNLQRTLPVSVEALQAFAQRAAAACAAVPGPLSFPDGELAVLFISDRRMAVLHGDYMGVPGPTDVITFQHGEIFISVQTARRNARHFLTSQTRELQLYIVHGLLHLRGYEDGNVRSARRMQALQEKILQRIAPPGYSR